MKTNLHLHSETIALSTALILLLIASTKPTIELERTISNYMIMVDVTQSMNVRDMQLNGKNVSRLDYTKALLKETIKALPCNTHVGLGVFFKADVALLYTPIETCSNLGLLWDTLNHIEWRMASQGNSNIRLGLQSIATRLLSMDTPTNVVFITDGEEAAPLNAINKTSLSGWHGGTDWLLIGVGNTKPSPIPKLDANNKNIGYWSIYSIKIAPSIAVNEGPNNVRDESYASAPYEYYLSKLDETYLKELASDIHGNYLKATTASALTKAMLNQKENYRGITNYDFSWVLAIAAILSVLSLYAFDMPNYYQKLTTFFRKNI
jgi:mxaL protein